MDYRMKFFASGKELKKWCGDALYGVTEEFARAYVMGLMMGMYAKYRKPRIKLYEIRDDGDHYAGTWG